MTTPSESTNPPSDDRSHQESAGDGPTDGGEWLDLTTNARPVQVAIGVLTAAAVVAVLVAHRSSPLLGVLLATVVVAYGALSIIDAAEQRLPNRITLPLAAATSVAVLIGGVVRSDVGAGFGAMGVGLLFAVVLFVLRFGMGDVKMALSVGTIAAWLGRETVMLTVFVGALAGAVVALALIVIYRRRTISFSYGPFLAIGSVAGMITAGLG
ncbi:MAG: A24 family peptidase [Actinomycetota bacterium]